MLFIRVDSDKPLAAYIYSTNSENIQRFKERISAGSTLKRHLSFYFNYYTCIGGMVINDSIIHFALPIPVDFHRIPKFFFVQSSNTHNNIL